MATKSPSQRLIRFLEEQWAERGNQMRFARQTGCSDSVTSKWKYGQPPDLTSCLRIAMYYKLDPYDVFEWAGKPEYGRLAHSLGISGGKPRPLWELYQDETRQTLHRQLDELLDAGYGDHAAEVVQREHDRSIGTFQRTCSYLREQVGAEASVLLSPEGTFLASDGEVSREEIEELKEGRNPSGWKRRQYVNIVACLRIAVLRKPGAVDVALAILQAQLSMYEE
jgi:hypothetical protein